jgi:hypothetical protein
MDIVALLAQPFKQLKSFAGPRSGRVRADDRFGGNEQSVDALAAALVPDHVAGAEEPVDVLAA